jgi:hypothetical protein
LWLLCPHIYKSNTNELRNACCNESLVKYILWPWNELFITWQLVANDLKLWHFSVTLYLWYSSSWSVVRKQIVILCLNSSVNHFYVLKFLVINLQSCIIVALLVTQVHSMIIDYTRHSRARDVSCRILLCMNKAVRLHGMWSIGTAGWDAFRFPIRRVPHSSKLCWLRFTFVFPVSTLTILGLNGEYGL